MAEIQPFRAWRYRLTDPANISQLTSPLFDVVSDGYRKRLYEHPYNSIHLSVPLDGDDGNALSAKIANWKRQGVIVQDRTPAIYVYYQYFRLQGDAKVYCRKGFVANIRVYDWEDRVILRHEDTMPYSVADRKILLEKTALNVSPTHGLYTDDDNTIEVYLDRAIAQPLYDCEDYQGVRDVLGVINDYDVITKIMAMMQGKQVILADGHHRYQGALAYIQEQQYKTGYTKDGLLNYQMMYLTNTASNNLRVFPTHRLINGLDHFNAHEFLKNMEVDFLVQKIEQENELMEIIAGKKWTFGLLIAEQRYLVKLKPEHFAKMTWDIPEKVKNLDLTVMHYFIIEQILGIKKADQPSTTHIQFERNTSSCLKKVWKDEVQLAILTQAMPMASVKAVCFSGHTLPQKSTYFYPKVICGYLFGSIKDEGNTTKVARSF